MKFIYQIWRTWTGQIFIGVVLFLLMYGVDSWINQ